MRPSLLALSLLAFVLAGCGRAPEAAFKGEREEHAYLSELSNPTPDQWRRRNELGEKFEQQRQAIERQQQEEERRREAERNSPAAVAARQKAEIDALLSRARHFDPIAPATAAGIYREVLARFPDGPEAKAAAEGLERAEEATKKVVASSQAARIMEQARRFEEMEVPNLAVGEYRSLIEKYPDSPEAAAARAAIKRLGYKPEPPEG